MNILMATNTYLPFVGGVERSLEIFTSEFRKNGNRVLIVAPEFENCPPDEFDVVRVPSIRKFNGTDFSLQLPIPGILHAALKNFTPDIVHSHHPFMLGDTALRIAAQFSVPIVFTHHTFYEKYTHYVTENSNKLKIFINTLATEYANLCNLVFAPSSGVARELLRRGVKTRMRILPTGIDTNAFKNGNRYQFRKRYGIARNSIVFGFVSRIAPEKNPEFLVCAVKELMINYKNIHFLVVGTGPSEQKIINEFKTSPFFDRCTFTGVLHSEQLINAYHAMDLFVFSSQTETQGLVVTEAMAAGLPVIAVNGPGIDEIVIDGFNGRLVNLDLYAFCQALEWFLLLDNSKIRILKRNALKTALTYSKEICAKIAIDSYSSLLSQKQQYKLKKNTIWNKTKRLIKAEYSLLKIMSKATGAAINKDKNYLL